MSFKFFAGAKRFLNKQRVLLARWASKPRILPERPLGTLIGALWQSSVVRGLLALLLLSPFFYGLPYTDVALRLGFLALLATWVSLCRKVSRHNRGRRFYYGLFRFFHWLALGLFLCPFLLVPLFYISFWLCAHYYWFATEAFAFGDDRTTFQLYPWPVSPKPKPPAVVVGEPAHLVIWPEVVYDVPRLDPADFPNNSLPPGKRPVWVLQKERLDAMDGRRHYCFALGGPHGPEPGDRFYATHGPKPVLLAPEAPPQPPRPPMAPAARFEELLKSTGVPVKRYHQELQDAADSLKLQQREIVRLLPKLLAETGLPPVEPPKVVAPGPLHPDYSRGGWRDWGHHLLVRLLKPVLLSDLSKIHKGPDVGLSWPLFFPSKEWPFFADIRTTLREGVSIHVGWRIDLSDGWRETKDPFFLELNQANSIVPRPGYYPPVTQEQLNERWWLGLSDDERDYVKGVRRLKKLFTEELPVWEAEMEARAPKAKNFTDLHELIAEIRLREAEIAYRGHFGVVKPATRVLELVYDVKRHQMEEMRFWFCGEYAWHRTQCPEGWQTQERHGDLRVLYSKMGGYSDSGRFNQRQGELGRLSFFPLTELPPYKTEWGTLARYWDCYDRPPLARDQQKQSGDVLLAQLKAGGTLDKKDVFRNGLGPYV